MMFRLQMVTVPVADVDRAKAFYAEQLGFTVEQDVRVDAHPPLRGTDATGF
jgi:catechol 2,3-dioxygenase-like lactoylglutathione lyase family enzyme